MKQIKTVEDFQKIMFILLKYNISKTTDGLTSSGEEKLSNERGTLFISNHRSTSLDPAYFNYILHQVCNKTAFIGAGDNIFDTDWLGHVIRVNKGFIIKRTVEDFDEKLYEAKRLSHYINSLLNDKQMIWIANKSGRAKDGLDQTDSVVLSMVFQGAEKENYLEFLNSINLIPLSISWEIIPLDLKLAKESVQDNQNQEQGRDLSNILSEIEDYKGRVHFSFCNRVIGEKRGAIVKAIDKEIHLNYKLWGVNWLAYLKLNDVSKEDKALIIRHIDVERAEGILNRGNLLTTEEKNFFYGIYANPVKSALVYFDSIQDYFKQSDLGKL